VLPRRAGRTYNNYYYCDLWMRDRDTFECNKSERRIVSVCLKRKNTHIYKISTLKRLNNLKEIETISNIFNTIK